MNVTSDVCNQSQLFLLAVQMTKGRQKEAGWLSKRGFGRSRGNIYRLVSALDDTRLWQYFGQIYAEDEVIMVKKGKKKVPSVRSPSWERWKEIGQELATFKRHQAFLIRHLVSSMGTRKLYLAFEGNYGMSGVNIEGDHAGRARGSNVSLSENELFMANRITIVPNHGGEEFDILDNVTMVSVADLQRALNGAVTVQDDLVHINGELLQAPKNNYGWNDDEDFPDIASLFDDVFPEEETAV